MASSVQGFFQLPMRFQPTDGSNPIPNGTTATIYVLHKTHGCRFPGTLRTSLMSRWSERHQKCSCNRAVGCETQSLHWLRSPWSSWGQDGLNEAGDAPESRAESYQRHPTPQPHQPRGSWHQRFFIRELGVFYVTH